MVLSSARIKQEADIARPDSPNTSPHVNDRAASDSTVGIPKTEVRDADDPAPCGSGTETNRSPLTWNDSRERVAQRVANYNEELANTRHESSPETSTGTADHRHEDGHLSQTTAVTKNCHASDSGRHGGLNCHGQAAPRTDNGGGDARQTVRRPLTNFSIDHILRADFGQARRCGSNGSNGYHGHGFGRFPSLVSPLSVGAASSSTSLLPAPVPGVSSSPRRLSSSSFLSAFSSVPPSSALVAKRPPSRQTAAPERYFNPRILTPPPSSPESSSSSFSPPSSSSLSSSSSTPSRHRVPPTTSPKTESPSAPPAAGLTPAAAASARPKAEDPNPATESSKQLPWPAWVYCTRYSDRPSSGPRYRKPRQSPGKPADKRPRTAFSTTQLQKLRSEFHDCPYLSEARRISLARELGLSESQVKIWFQNKRAKLKKGCGVRNPLAQLLMEEGLYNHSTIIVKDSDNDSNSGCSNNAANN